MTYNNTMNKKRIAVFGVVSLLIGSVATSVYFDDMKDDIISDNQLSEEMTKAYDKVTELQVQADLEAIDNSDAGVKYSMLGC